VVRPSSLSPPLIVNYDAFKLDEDVANAYAEMVCSLEGSFYLDPVEIGLVATILQRESRSSK
jgi:hypothetical protein